MLKQLVPVGIVVGMFVASSLLPAGEVNRTLYLKDGVPRHEYNFFALERTNIGGAEPLAPGKHTIRYEFIPDGKQPGAGCKSILSVDGKTVAEGQIPKTQPYSFSGDEGADVGVDAETNVSPDYPQHDNAFTGTIHAVTIEQKSSATARPALSHCGCHRTGPLPCTSCKSGNELQFALNPMTRAECHGTLMPLSLFLTRVRAARGLSLDRICPCPTVEISSTKSGICTPFARCREVRRSCSSDCI